MKNFISVATTEEEQVEQVKKWIKDNYLAIIAGVIIGFGGIFGLDFYNNYQHSQNLQARESFLQGNISENQNYNLQQSLIHAKNDIEAADYQAAITKLENAHTDTILQDVKNIALAKVYLQQQEFQKAVSLLEHNSLDSAKHLLGDVYLDWGKTELALETYTLAHKNTQNNQIKAILDIKINDIK
jgi:predicted negative regulator of RcsB-dependent stress response